MSYEKEFEEYINLHDTRYKHVQGWALKEVYLAARQKGEEERERLREACRIALRLGTFHQVNEEQQAKKLIMKALEAT
jgi:hypothetical protein